MGKTKIEWTDSTWSPVTGCSKISLGCKNCYAESLARRFNPDFKPWTPPNAEHNVRLHPERLEQPLRWRKPRRVFVNSVSDLFHEQVPPYFIADVWRVMRKATKHIFQILTKRPEHMAAFLRSGDEILPNVWLGVSAEDQPTFDERTKYLLQTPAAVRFVSLEPLLGPIILDDGPMGGGHTALTTEIDHAEDTKLDWVIVGGESGPGARPMHPDWVRLIRDQCQAASVNFWFKQWGLWKPVKERDWNYRKDHLYLDNDEEDWPHMMRVGKKAAGNELDGRVWEEMPT